MKIQAGGDADSVACAAAAFLADVPFS